MTSHPQPQAVSATIETVIIGRNDEYEPHWTQNLYAVIRHNRALFAGSPVDYRVAFVEWNPLAGRPLLAGDLLREFPFLRVIVADREVHAHLSESPSLHMMLNFAINAALRTSRADYLLISGADDFLGTDLAKRIIRNGLVPRRLYRAERVNIRNTLDFPKAAAAAIESPQNVVHVDSCSEPPWDVPPYTNACGDFILMDRGSMHAIRGFDEGIRMARLHLDSRCCWTAMVSGLDCELLGRIYHITHARSLTTMKSAYPDIAYNALLGIPYRNPSSWGLSDFRWQRLGDRQLQVSLPGNGASGLPRELEPPVHPGTAAVAAQLLLAFSAGTPAQPPGASQALPGRVEAKNLTASPGDKGSSVVPGTPASLRTGREQWSLAASIRFDTAGLDLAQTWYWVRLQVRIKSGMVGVGLLTPEGLQNEHYMRASVEPVEIFIPLAVGTAFLNAKAPRKGWLKRGRQAVRGFLMRAARVTPGKLIRKLRALARKTLLPAASPTSYSVVFRNLAADRQSSELELHEAELVSCCKSAAVPHSSN